MFYSKLRCISSFFLYFTEDTFQSKLNTSYLHLIYQRNVKTVVNSFTWATIAQACFNAVT